VVHAQYRRGHVREEARVVERERRPPVHHDITGVECLFDANTTARSRQHQIDDAQFAKFQPRDLWRFEQDRQIDYAVHEPA
jgi:hypothetical protein